MLASLKESEQFEEKETLQKIADVQTRVEKLVNQKKSQLQQKWSNSNSDVVNHWVVQLRRELAHNL